MDFVSSDDSPLTPSELAESSRAGPGLPSPESEFLEIWNTLPAGKRGVVRVGGLPAMLSPKDRELFEQVWPRRRPDCMRAMRAISSCEIQWDRSPVTIKEFFGSGLIDELLAGKHKRREAEQPTVRHTESQKEYYKQLAREKANEA